MILFQRITCRKKIVLLIVATVYSCVVFLYLHF